MSKQEKIVCAAVKFKVESIAHPEVGAHHEILLCVNYDDTFVKEKRFDLCGLGYEVATEETKGFITNKGRFVDAKTAKRIAVTQNQLRLLNEHGIKSFELLEEGFTEITINGSERTVINLLGKLKPEDLY